MKRSSQRIVGGLGTLLALVFVDLMLLWLTA